jgi:hypothetical protein
MAIAALAVSVVALTVSAWAANRQLAISRQANSVQVLVDMFAEHRGADLAAVREYLGGPEMQGLDPTKGFKAFGDKQTAVRDLAWYYDNLGVLVTHGVVDLAPVSGYLGASVVTCWDVLKDFVEHERLGRAQSPDPNRYQEYFENLAVLVQERDPMTSRTTAKLWRLAPQRDRVAKRHRASTRRTQA